MSIVFPRITRGPKEIGAPAHPLRETGLEGGSRGATGGWGRTDRQGGGGSIRENFILKGQPIFVPFRIFYHRLWPRTEKNTHSKIVHFQNPMFAC